MPVSVVIFDLDGTLIDSAADVAHAVNGMLAALGREPLAPEAVRAMIGDGMAKLVERALAARDLTGVDAREAQRLCLSRYEAEPVRATVPYPGVRATLEQLREEQLRLAVCTNKPAHLSTAWRPAPLRRPCPRWRVYPSRIRVAVVLPDAPAPDREATSTSAQTSLQPSAYGVWPQRLDSAATMARPRPPLACGPGERSVAGEGALSVTVTRSTPDLQVSSIVTAPDENLTALLSSSVVTSSRSSTIAPSWGPPMPQASTASAIAWRAVATAFGVLATSTCMERAIWGH
jgi:hypothetical protein